VATAPDGSVYVNDGQGVVRQFNDTSTWEKAIAGVGLRGYGGDGSPAASARLQSPQATGVDGSGNLLITDTGNDRIRRSPGSGRPQRRALRLQPGQHPQRAGGGP
jgi:hypothetical protein